MNRSLMVPAAFCLIAFASLLAALRGAPAAPRDMNRAAADAAITSAPRADAPAITRRLAIEEAAEILTTLRGEYLRSWREWERSPHRLYSRAAPHPIPSISAEVTMSPGAAGESEGCLFATIDIQIGSQSQRIPCVVDRSTKRVQLFALGQWLTADEWLKQAPQPQRF